MPAKVDEPTPVTEKLVDDAVLSVVCPRTSSVPVATTSRVNRSSDVILPLTPSVVPGVVVPTPTLERNSPLPVTVRVEEALRAFAENVPDTVDDAWETNPPPKVARFAPTTSSVE
mgnify:FL=1